MTKARLSPLRLAVSHSAPARKDEVKPTYGKGAFVISASAPVQPAQSAPSLDNLTAEQRAVVEACLSGRNVFFTGSAGTGKSYVLRAIVDALREKWTADSIYVTVSDAA